MNLIKRLYHLLGGIHCAIILIATAALTVIAGTFLESYTESHLYAASWIYSHPLFFVLLSLFFVNILFSATRRWPFKRRHIPFLITHLGLLMMISGTMVKNKWGLQGNLILWEGSGNQKVFSPYTYGLFVENREGKSAQYELTTLEARQTFQKDPLPELKLKIVHSLRHVSEKWETWIKGNYAIIAGIPPLPLTEWTSRDPLPQPTLIPISKENNWNVVAVKTNQLNELIAQLYLSDIKVKTTPESVHEPLIMISMDESNAFQDPFLAVEHHNENFRIPLNGDLSLVAQSTTPSINPGTSSQFDLHRPFPLLVLTENHLGLTYLFLFDTYGRVHSEIFGQGGLKSLASYDQGFGGYAVQATLPNPALARNRIQKEQAARQLLCKQLSEAMVNNPTLAPPLHFFKKACDQAQMSFIDQLVEFLFLWDQSHTNLYSPSHIDEGLKQIIDRLEWDDLPKRERKAIHWVALLFDRIGSVQTKQELYQLLKRNHWPFLKELKKATDDTVLTQLAQQIFSLIDDLPDVDMLPVQSPSEKVRLLSSYLKAFGIEYRSIVTYPEEKNELLSLETSLTLRHNKETPLNKFEDNVPCVLIEAQLGEQKQVFSLSYDSSGFGFRWPILNGRYLIRFQPHFTEIPYRVRLKQARQINYPQSQQPYSYEATIWISEKGKEPLEKTLSMNQVYETWEGYRFYLAGMSPASDTHVRRAQIVVNHDPAKYYLTYPGALLIALGILLLFWFNPYKISK